MERRGLEPAAVPWRAPGGDEHDGKEPTAGAWAAGWKDVSATGEETRERECVCSVNI